MKRILRRFYSIIPLNNRKYIEINGKDTKKFLQGLITNDINSLTKENSVIVSALLNPKGRVINDMFIYDRSTNDNDQKCLIEVHNQYFESLFRFLNLYKLRSVVSFEKKQNYQTILKFSNEDPSNIIFRCPDPRVENLCERIIVDHSISNSTTPIVESNDEKSLADYEIFRLLHGLPESSELEGEIPLESNLDLLNYISFTKGCYVGQELTARTKYRGVVRKRLIPFIFTDNNTPFSQHSKPGFNLLNSELINEIENNVKSKFSQNLSKVPIFPRQGGDSVGHIIKIGQYSNLGLALIKLQNLKNSSSFQTVEEGLNSDFVTEGNSLLIRPFRPSWWKDNDPLTGNPIIPPIEQPQQ